MAHQRHLCGASRRGIRHALITASTVVAVSAVVLPAQAVEPAPAAPIAPLLVVAERPAASAGAMAAPVDPVPGDVLVVSQGGSDSSDGSQAAPFRTIGHAIAAAPSGAAIVVRGGSYPESAEIPDGKSLTLQNWPGEVVWLDGSTRLDGWVPDRGVWRVDGWTAAFDRSPTYARGAPDSDQEHWRWIDPEHPAAAWPEQVWVAGKAQRQVTSREQVRPGAFYVDEAGDRLFLGTDPTGRTVTASVLAKGLTIRGADSTVRGIGVRRYATSVPLMGTITVEARGVRLEDVRAVDNATTGIFAGAPDVVLRAVTAADNGLTGITASNADGLVVTGAALLDNNREQFNETPVSGGIKVGRSRGVTILDSRVSGNRGPGVWVDESTFDSRILGNDIVANTGHGIVVEISATSLIAGNVVRDNGAVGRSAIKINNTSGVRIWNNTLLGGEGTLAVVQDRRRYRPDAVGADPRSGDEPMSWLNGPIEIRNNVLGGAQRCVLCVEDHTHARTAEQIGVSSDSDVFAGAYEGALFAVWAAGTDHPATFATLADFRDGTGMESGGWAAPDDGGPTALPIPAEIADAIGVAPGTEAVGALP